MSNPWPNLRRLLNEKPQKTYEEGKILLDISIGKFSLLITKRQRKGVKL